ncbi:hypothetical protein BDB01DRAFT_100810 [Pilobolus umbonatus]|nr:hypothetical protein BDB01DRAFT_100810 [Pilobolus umbonatus]
MLNSYYCGIIALLAVVIIWVTSSFIMNSLFGDMNYNKPFLITYLNTATFSFYLLPLLFKQRKQSEYPKLSTANYLKYSAMEDGSSTKLIESIEQRQSDKLSTLETVKLSLAFCILWFIANYTTNASLAYTTVGSSTIFASMSGLFTLMIGSLFNVERMNLVKILAVCTSLMGIILVSYSDHTTKHQLPLLEERSLPRALIGDLLALIGALFYGFYTILLKLRIGSEDRIDMSLFFGFVGAFNILLLWPMIPILDFIGLESFEFPMNYTLWSMIMLNAFVGTFLSDYLWLLSMLLTSPLVVTLGISLTIPFALIGDILFKGIIPNINYSIGALLVIIGFLIVNSDALKKKT